ncbi:MAG: PIG-L deacetylase family protein [Anaerolineales bacterium]
MNTPENWESSKKILVILAHPDDPEFFCGATIAHWTSDGHQVSYCLLTCGDKGASDINTNIVELCKTRQKEQHAAASILGVHKVQFLGYKDGCLQPDMQLRRDITRIIRQEKPEILLTCDPTTLYIRDTRINHPDHRAAGQAVLDAVFPASGNPLYFIELWREESLAPHSVQEVWASLTTNPNVVLDVTAYWDIKIQALMQHTSQIDDLELLNERMRRRHTQDSTFENPRYEEGFKRIIFEHPKA